MKKCFCFKFVIICYVCVGQISIFREGKLLLYFYYYMYRKFYFVVMIVDNIIMLSKLDNKSNYSIIQLL